MAGPRRTQIALQGVQNAVSRVFGKASAARPLRNSLNVPRVSRAGLCILEDNTIPSCRRCFSQTSPILSKKKGKVHKVDPEEAARQAQPIDPKNPKPNPDDPFNLTDVELGYKRIDEHHEDKLKKLKVGGRFNPDAVGALRVRPDKHSSDTYPLRELAQVAHKGGRNVSILVNEAEYIKPIMSAVQASPDFNQQPQHSPDNELELLIKIVPENPDEQAKRVKEVCHTWREQIRDQLRKRSKEHAKWSGAKLVTADDVRRLDKEVKKLQDQQMAVIDAKEKKALQEVTSKQNRL